MRALPLLSNPIATRFRFQFSPKHASLVQWCWAKKYILDYNVLACIMYSMHCKKCLTTEGYLTVTSTKYRKDGSRYAQYICRPCNAKKKRDELVRNNKAARRAEKNYRKKFPEKHKARLLARKNILLEPCEVCGSLRSMRHHPDYSKPLEVVFLCQLHHSLTHQGVI